jgi:hypothetical protein
MAGGQSELRIAGDRITLPVPEMAGGLLDFLEASGKVRDDLGDLRVDRPVLVIPTHPKLAFAYVCQLSLCADLQRSS